MIVDPDFFEHWRTRMLVDALGGDQMAPMYVMRIWAHCQSRRGSRFDMPSSGLKALCRFTGDAVLLEKSLIDAGFIQRDGGAIEAPKWAEYNQKLIANWENGGKGGRPKKTDEEPSDNPKKTQTEPTATQANPIRVDEIREEKEEKSKTRAKASAAPKSNKPIKVPLPNDFCLSDPVMAWAAKNGHSNLQMHFDSFVGKARANGYTYADWDQALQNAIREDWAKLGAQARASPARTPLDLAAAQRAATEDGRRRLFGNTDEVIDAQ